MSDIPLHHWISRRRGFIERTLADLVLVMDRSHAADAASSRSGVLQSLDPRVKLLGTGLLILNAAATQELRLILALVILAAALAWISDLPLRPLARLWMTVGVLAAMLAIPAMFLTPGQTLWNIPVFDWRVTEQGGIVAAKLVSRAMASSTLAAILVLSTPWQIVLKAMRSFRVPIVVVVLIGMSYRYVFLFLESAIEMMESRKSRTVGSLPAAERRHLAIAGIGVLLERALTLGTEIHLAMQARGYRGELHLLNDFAMRCRDWIALGLLFTFQFLLIAGLQ